MPSANPSSLSPDARDIAAAYAVAYPERPARTRVMGWINKARRQKNARNMTSDQARIAVDELIQANMLLGSGSSRVATGPTALPGTITGFCEMAVEQQLAADVIEGLRDHYRHSYYDNNQCVSGQRLRVELIAGNLADLDRFQLDADDWLWLLEPRAEPYLKKLPPELRQQACAVCLSYAVETFQRLDVFVETCESCAPLFHELAPTVALGCVLAGDFERAQQCFTELPVAVQNSKPIAVGAIATDALIATLRGDDELAFKKISACIEAEKIGTRKRKVYPEPAAFSLSLLSLLRTPRTAERGMMMHSLRSMVKSSPQAARYSPLFELAESAESPTVERRSVTIVGRSLHALLNSLASQWHVNYAPTDVMQGAFWLRGLFKSAESAGYRWVAAETLTVLEALDQCAEMDAESLKLSAAERHQQLGTRTLTALVQTLEPWELSLQTLESLVPKNKMVKKALVSKSETQSRLVWQVASTGRLDIKPLEQRLGKNGKWSTGRPVSLKRLQSKAGEMDFLTDKDKKAAAAFESWHVGWGSNSREYGVGARAVYQLVGHPDVYNTNEQKIDIVERAARLVIDTRDDHLKVTMTPEPRGSNSYRMTLDDNSTRLEVTHFTAAHLRIYAALSLHGIGIKVPLSAKQRLLDIAASLAVDIPVQSDSQDDNSEQHQGNPDPLIQLDYSGQTLGVQIQVEPLTGIEQFFNSGEGGAIVYVTTDAGTVQVVRDLPAERDLMQSLIASSVQLSKEYDGRSTMLLSDTESILELLDELQQLDIRCLWPRDLPLKITARAESRQLSLKIKSASEWFSASGELQYSPEDSLSLSHLLKLIGNSPQSRFLELAKGEFLALSTTLQSQLQALQSYGKAQSSKDGEQRLHSLSMLALEPLFEAAQISADKHWRQWRERLQKAGQLHTELPTTLEADLRPYQLDGFRWLVQIAELGAGACLADDMGLGKTLQTLALLLHRAPDGPALVVAPTSVTGNWQQEAQRFAPTLNVTVYGGSAEDRQQLLQQLQPFDLIIVSYGLLHNDIDNLSEVHWHTVVLDEAQAIKNATTQRAKAARKLKTGFRLATTGTPIQNNLMDLHSLFAFLIPGFLGSAAKFRSTFALPVERDNDHNAREQLRALVAPFMLRRHKRDVLKDLPARTDITLTVELSGEEAVLYEVLRQQALDALMQSSEDSASGRKKLRVLAELMRLRRLCCNPQLIQPDWIGPMAKLSLFASTVEELLANQHKVLVFSQFVDHLKILQVHLQQQNISYQYLDGSTTAKQRTERVTAFQSGQGDVFLISLTAGGTGLNLTAADYVIHMDPWWNPAVEDQASDRAHRIGQQRPVTIYRMVTAGTIEAQIQELHTTKRELADSLLADTDSTKFDMEVLLSMLQSPNPVR